MFRPLEQHFGLATTHLLCFDLITGQGEFHIQFIFFPVRPQRDPRCGLILQRSGRTLMNFALV
jgi:hypothetical protein